MNNNSNNINENKINIVFIPGLVNDKQLWEQQIAGLKDIANCIVADISKYDNIADLAKDVLKQAPEKFILIGLSMGGYVSLEIMRQAPQKILALALCNTNARADSQEASENRKKSIALAKKDFLEAINDILPKFIHPLHLNNKELIATIHSMANNLGVQAFEKQQTAIMHRIDSRPYLRNITCPSIIICGDEDQLTPVNLHEEMAEMITSSTLHIIKECGHLSPLEQPQEVTHILRQWIVNLTNTNSLYNTLNDSINI